MDTYLAIGFATCCIAFAVVQHIRLYRAKKALDAATAAREAIEAKTGIYPAPVLDRMRARMRAEGEPIRETFGTRKLAPSDAPKWHGVHDPRSDVYADIAEEILKECEAWPLTRSERDLVLKRRGESGIT